MRSIDSLSTRFLAPLAAALAPLAAAAAADTLKVPTQAHPTIASAVAAAQPGDTIQIAPNNAPGSQGVYTESLTVTNAKNGLRFIGTGGVIWDGGNVDTLSFVGGYQNAFVQGITFRNGQNQLKVFGDHATVKDCTFIGSLVNGAIRLSGSSNTITHVTIRSALHRGIYIEGPDAAVSSSTFEAITGPGVQVYLGDRAVISHCTFTGCASGVMVDPANDVQITNNTVTNALADGFVLRGLRPVVKNNKIRGVGGIPTNPDQNCGIRGTNATEQALITGNTIEATGGYAICIDGIQAVITKNKLTNTAGGISIANASTGAADGPTIAGNTIKSSVGTCEVIAVVSSGGVKITNNTIDVAGGLGILVIGPSAVIQANKLTSVRGGIQVGAGSSASLGGPQIADNKIDGCLVGSAIRIDADQFDVKNNVVSRVLYFGDGIHVEPLGLSVPNGLVAANKIVGASGFGIHILVGHSSVTNNTVVDCGSGSVGTGGIRVVAISGSLTNNTVTGAAGDGYAIQGSSIYLIDCVASGCSDDGFDIRSGNGNSLDGCTAIGCAAEGLDNSAGVTGTGVQNCVFSKCRIDFAGNGTLALDTNNTYKTGGPGTPPAIDQQ